MVTQIIGMKGPEGQAFSRQPAAAGLPAFSGICVFDNDWRGITPIVGIVRISQWLWPGRQGRPCRNQAEPRRKAISIP